MLVKFADKAGAENGLAVAMYHSREGKVKSMEVAARFATEEEAKTFAAQFPKYMKIKATSSGGRDENGNWRSSGWVMAHFDFASTKATGVRNDASIKRALKLFEIADKKGIKLFCDDRHALNSIVGREAMIETINAL